MSDEYKCAVCGREYSGAISARNCRHGAVYEVVISQNNIPQELKDVRTLTNKTDIDRANRIMAARKKLEHELNYDD